MLELLSLKTKDTANKTAKVIAVAGELDESNLEHLEDELRPILDDKRILNVILDFSKLEFINSRGIGFLVSVHTHLARDSRKLIVANARMPVMDVIALVGLTSIIPHFPTVDKALKSLKP